LAATGLAATGLAATELAATGLAATGLVATGLAATGLAATGLAATGLAATGLAAAISLSVPGVEPFCLSLASTAGTTGLAFLAGSEALLSLLFRLTAPSRKQGINDYRYMFLAKTKKERKK
jgi:hypothetical protein